ncbi:MAG: hypothetical protein WCO52_03700 [bacterium]
MASTRSTGASSLLTLNKEQSALFCSPDAHNARRLYRAKHPTAVAAFKCMDGRLNLSVITKTQAGLIQPFRNLGGKFDLGWPYFGKMVKDWVDSSISQGRDCLILVTYHFSKGDTHRGCRGFNYDVDKAQESTSHLKKQVEDIFGSHHSVIYPIQVGIETDEDALLIHGENGEILDLGKESDLSESDLLIRLAKLFPSMKQRVRQDLLRLLVGNQRHIHDIREENRPIADAEHKEWVLAVGRGFDWLHTLNTALIVGPYSPDLADPIRVAAGLLWDNIASGRIPKTTEMVLLASSPSYELGGTEWQIAVEKSNFMAHFAMDVVAEHAPELAKIIKPVVGVVDMHTLLFHPQKY